MEGHHANTPRHTLRPDVKAGPFGRLPVELISKTLTFACNNERIEENYRFPSVSAMVSKRFHTITLYTPALWRYIWLPKLSPTRLAHIETRIARSGVVPLVGEIGIHRDQVPQASQVLDLISRISSRLSAVKFYSYSSDDPVLAFLQISMPQLTHLDISARSSGIGPATLSHEIPPARFPALKTLVSANVFNCSYDLGIPKTVEELRLTLCWKYGGRPRRAVWNFLPLTVRILRLSHLPSHGTDRPTGGKYLLSQLLELTINPCFDSRELVFLDAPSLKTLKMVVADSVEHVGYVTWTTELDFPALERFELTVKGSSMPWLESLLECCPTLREVYLRTGEYREEVYEFIEALAADPSLLPNLVHLTAPGSSILSLRQVVTGRPHIQSLGIHPLDKGLTSLATMDEFGEWEECVKWLEDQIDLKLTGQTCGSSSSYFYPDHMERYYAWKDMRSGIAIDPRDWQGAEFDDLSFWRVYQAQGREEVLIHTEANGGHDRVGGLITQNQNTR